MGIWKCHTGLGCGDGKALIIDMLKYVLGMCWVFVTQLKAYIVYGGGGGGFSSCPGGLDDCIINWGGLPFLPVVLRIPVGPAGGRNVLKYLLVPATNESLYQIHGAVRDDGE